MPLSIYGACLFNIGSGFELTLVQLISGNNLLILLTIKTHKSESKDWLKVAPNDLHITLF